MDGEYQSLERKYRKSKHLWNFPEAMTFTRCQNGSCELLVLFENIWETPSGLGHYHSNHCASFSTLLVGWEAKQRIAGQMHDKGMMKSPLTRPVLSARMKK